MLELRALTAQLEQQLEQPLQALRSSALMQLPLIVDFTGPISIKGEDNSLLKKPFFIDWCSQQLQWRLTHSGRGSEDVIKACLGKYRSAQLIDVSAGLGRDSLVLQNAGAQVIMYERNPLVYLLLYDALHRAQQHQELFVQGLPQLAPFGSCKEQGLPAQGEVIYYDPMFPQRHKAAKVKLQMQIFHQIVGADEDSHSYAQWLVTQQVRRVVIKRPARAEVLTLRKPSYSVGTDQLRFDCYVNEP